MKVKDLRANPANPRTITDEKLVLLEKSLRAFGDLSGIVYNKQTERLVGGHQRSKVLPETAEIYIEKKYSSPTPTGTVSEGYVIVDGERYSYREVQWSEEREKAANIAANQHGGEFDFKKLAEWINDLDHLNVDLDLLGFSETELSNIMAPVYPEWDKDPREDTQDEVPEVKETNIKLGDLFQLGEHRLLCGDSTDKAQVDRLMNGKKADMVFTDPPYGVNVENTKGSIIGDGDLETFKACLPILKQNAVDDAHFYVWMAAGDMLPPSVAAFVSVIPFQNILPIRCTHENKRGPKGSFKHNYEACLFGNNNKRGFNSSKKFPVSEATTRDNRYEGDGYLKVYPALWDGERATEHNMNIEHPTQKKVGMIEFYVEISCNNKETVLDLFLGSGSTLIACEKTNRKCLGMEIDPQYCQVIIDRWEKFTGQKATKIE